MYQFEFTHLNTTCLVIWGFLFQTHNVEAYLLVTAPLFLKFPGSKWMQICILVHASTK